jgi:EAL domain-containing protein (putative c-di-GMP-specific phosphodiesterase class I)
VETDSQARYLRSNGCLTMQGYLFHRPMPLPRFIDVLRTQGLPAEASNVLAFQA